MSTKPSLQTSILQSLLGAIAILGLVTVPMKEPLFFVKFIQFMQIGGGIMCLGLEGHRKFVESGEADRRELNKEWIRFNQEKDKFDRWKQNEEVQWERVKEKQAKRLAAELTLKTEELEAEWRHYEASNQNLGLREEKLQRILSSLGEREAQLLEGKAALDAYQAQLEQIEADINVKLEVEVQRLESEKRVEIALARKQIMAESQRLYEEVIDLQDKLNVERAAFVAYREQELEAELARIHAATQELKHEEKIRDEKTTEREREIEAKIVQARKDAVNLAMDKWNEKAKAEAHLFEVLEQTIRTQQAYIENLVGGMLKAPPEKGAAGLIADRVVALIRDDLGVPCYYHDCFEVKNSGSDPGYVVWIRRAEGVKIDSYAPLRKTIEHELSLGSCQMASVRGYLLITFGNVSTYIANLPIEASTEKSAARKPRVEGKIQEPSEAMLHAFIRNLRHLAVLGAQESGKSSLVRSLANAKIAYLGGLDKVDLQFVDIKHPDEDAPWILHGKKCKPQYHEYLDTESADYIGLAGEDMAESFARRSNERKRRDRNNQAIPKFREMFWFWEEAPSVIDKLRGLASAPIKFGIRVSRGMQGNVWLMSQTDKVSDLGFKKPDMNNMTRIYIGFDTIVAGLSEMTLTKERKTQILADIYARQALAEQQIEEGNTNKSGLPPAAFCALVRTPAGQVFLWSLPLPGNWQSIPIPELDDEDKDSTRVPDSELIPLSSDEVWEMVESELDPDEREETAGVKPRRKASDLSVLQERIIESVASLKEGETPTFGQLTTRFKRIREAYGKGASVRSADVEAACRDLVEKNVGEFKDSFRYTIPELPTDLQHLKKKQRKTSTTSSRK